MNRYELVTYEGALACTVETSSFQKARSYFAIRYTGNYKIIIHDRKLGIITERKVRL